MALRREVVTLFAGDVSALPIGYELGAFFRRLSHG